MNFAAIYIKIWKLIDWNLFIYSALIFLTGVISAPWVIKFQLNFLIKYPTWMYRILLKYIKYENGFLALFVLIFSLNTISLFLDLVVGWGIFLPFLVAYLTGLNIAIIAYNLGGSTGILALFFNPVALIELPAAWLALSAGMKLGISIIQTGSYAQADTYFRQGLDLFVFFVIPLLAIAAILESTLISFVREFHEEDQ
jgi:uncharacterized membrane protein SpoIIM required for sporulation